jgi:outer membrane cobalamin receptor
VEKEQIVQNLGSRDVPMILNTTPGVYASETGGGAGDSRINVRGFDQRNTAVLINGVPVNDMENGWVYWSNWDGLGDVTSSIQMQRGLGASNLAIASVGGTMNIQTDPAAKKAGITYKQEFGNANFLKGTLSLNSGRMNNGFAISAAVVRKVGNGIVDQAWTDAWAYYGAISYAMSKNHTIELYAVGAPQQHGQRRFTKPIEYYDSEYAAEIFRSEKLPEESIQTALEGQNYGRNFNAHWGPIFEYDANDLKEYYNGSTHDYPARTPYLNGEKADFNSSRVINEITNYFHKPQFNLNWHWSMSDNALLSTVAYVSIGRGGGTGTFSSSSGRVSLGTIGEGDYEGDHFVGSQDWQSLYNTNSTTLAGDADSALVAEGKVGANERKAGRVLRNSVNRHDWYGLLSTFDYRFNKQLKLTTGIDLRSYTGEHWREVRNLMGGDYILDDNDLSNGNDDDEVNRLGDKIDYHNDGFTRWYGGFAQLEGKKGNLTLVGTGSLSQTGYKRKDYFVDPNAHNEEGSKILPTESGWENFTGGTAKIGANYNANAAWNVFVNFGFLSTAPEFDAVFTVSHQLYENPLNEKTYSVEVGTGYRTTHSNTNINFYYTSWQDRSWSQSVDGADGITRFYRLLGIDARHYGIELDYTYKPMRWFDARLMVSIGDWTWLNDVETTVTSEVDPNDVATFNVFADGLKVADAAQKTLSIGATARPVKGLYVNATFTTFGDNFSQFDPEDRDDPNDRTQPWRIPNYSLTDLHFGYLLPFDISGKVKFELFGHVFNLFDRKYITDAVDNDSFIGRPTVTSHTAESATIHYGLERRFNLGFNIML